MSKFLLKFPIFSSIAHTCDTLLEFALNHRAQLICKQWLVFGLQSVVSEGLALNIPTHTTSDMLKYELKFLPYHQKSFRELLSWIFLFFRRVMFVCCVPLCYLWPNDYFKCGSSRQLLFLCITQELWLVLVSNDSAKVSYFFSNNRWKSHNFSLWQIVFLFSISFARKIGQAVAEFSLSRNLSMDIVIR